MVNFYSIWSTLSVMVLLVVHPTKVLDHMLLYKCSSLWVVLLVVHLTKVLDHMPLYKCSSLWVNRDINPSELNIHPKCFNIPLLDCLFTGISRFNSKRIFWFNLSQGIPNILQPVARVPNSSFVYESSDECSSCVCSSFFAFECHLRNSIPASPMIFSDISLIF